MHDADNLWFEAREALEEMWFIQSLEALERTDFTLSLRLYVRPDLFVQAFLGELTGSFYFALIEGGQRIFGVDREADTWHLHPYKAPHTHEPLPEGLGPEPLLVSVAGGGPIIPIRPAVISPFSSSLALPRCIVSSCTVCSNNGLSSTALSSAPLWTSWTLWTLTQSLLAQHPLAQRGGRRACPEPAEGLLRFDEQ